MTAMPEGKIVCIGGDGGEYNCTGNTEYPQMGEQLLRNQTLLADQKNSKIELLDLPFT